MDLGEGLRQALAKLSRATIIDAKTIKEFIKDLQKTMISADVEVRLVFELSKAIEDAALKSKPPAGLSPKDYITEIVYQQLVRLMGESYEPQLKSHKILLMGLYGSGKTTMAAKLAKYYQDRGMSAGVVCCDVARPAAYEQLETLAKNANVGFFGVRGEKDAAKIITLGVAALKNKSVIICDTSGRNALDGQLIEELRRVDKALVPDQKILVLSADVGQVAGRQAREFDAAVKISGVIVTKLDGSSKGGGALSAASAAKAHVMFIGTGEKLADVEAYNAADFIGNLLGVPNIKALVLNVQKAVQEAGIKPEQMEIDELNYETFYTQLKAVSKMGSLKSVFGMIGMPDVPKEVVEQGSDKLKKYEVIIASMTKDERRDAKLLHSQGRIRRVAKGSGTSEKDVHMMIAEFNKMKKVFDTMKNDRGLRKRFQKFM